MGNAVTDGTGLIGDALTDAYTQAADKAERIRAGETGARESVSWLPQLVSIC